MIVTTEPKPEQQAETKEWEDPKNPEKPSDARDKEQAQRLFEEAQRQKENLTETEDKE